MREELLDEYYSVRAYWFDSYANEGDKEGFFHLLEMNGYRVVATPLRDRDGTRVEKGVDIRLTTEFLAHGFNESYDTAVVVTGDDDYERAVEYVQGLGKRVVVASWAANAGRRLKQLSDEFIELDSIADTIER